MYDMSPLQYISKTFTHLSKVNLPNIRKGLVKVTFPSPFQYLNSSLSKSLSTLNVYLCAVSYLILFIYFGNMRLKDNDIFKTFHDITYAIVLYLHEAHSHVCRTLSCSLKP